VRPQSCLRAPGTLGRRQRAIGIYFTLETIQERGTGRLGRLLGVTLGVEAVGSQAGAKGSLCRGQPPSVMHSNPSLLVATPPDAFRPPRTATRTPIRGAGFSYRWTRDQRSGVEPLSDGALIDSQHFSQEHSQTSSWDGSSGSAITQCGSARAWQLTATLTATLTAPGQSPVSRRARVGGTPGAVPLPSSLTARRTPRSRLACYG
jgi:hypothetical protein